MSLAKFMKKEIGDHLLLYEAGKVFLGSRWGTTDKLQKTIEDHLEKFKNFIIDFSQIQHMYEEGIGRLMGLYSLIKKKHPDGKLMLLGIAGQPREKLETTQLIALFELCPSMDLLEKFIKERPVKQKTFIITLDSEKFNRRNFADKVDMCRITQEVNSLSNIDERTKVIIVFDGVFDITFEGIGELARLKEFVEKKKASFIIIPPISNFNQQTFDLLIGKISGDCLFTYLEEAIKVQ